MKKSLLLLPLLALLAGNIPSAGAQSVGIKISPVVISEAVEPGQTFRGELTVANDSDIPKTLFAFLRDFRAEGEEGKPRLIRPGAETGSFLASWISVPAEGIDFEPREEKRIPYTVNVPVDTGPGGYYGAILFGTQPPSIKPEGDDRGAGMSFSQQAGALLLLRVKGETFEEARVREFTTDQGSYGTPFKTQFLLRIENIGNVHVAPVGTIAIENMWGKEVGQLFVNEGGGNVLPRSIRRYTAEWDGQNGFGRYRAKLALSYGAAVSQGGQGKQSLFSEVTFWVFPWRIIIPLLLALTFLLGIAILLLRLYRNKAVRKAMAAAGLGHIRTPYRQGPSPVLHFSVILFATLVALLLVIVAVFFVFFA